MISRLRKQIWPSLDNGDRWLEAQMMQESRGISVARSGAGAMGLFQLMPGTADEMGVKDPFDPEENARGGIRYLKIQYDHFPEIPDTIERLKWSLASYNGGRGYINRALRRAREDKELLWWKWEPGRYWLMSRDCVLPSGRRPDYKQMWDYVARIVARVGAGTREVDTD